MTEAGVQGNVSVALQYLEAWLRGSGAVAINNLMEDTATAEIARAQLWQWIHHGTPTEAGRPVTLAGVRDCCGGAELRRERDGRALAGGGAAAGRAGRGGAVPGIPDAGGVPTARGERRAGRSEGPRRRGLAKLGRLGSNQQPPG